MRYFKNITFVLLISCFLLSGCVTSKSGELPENYQLPQDKKTGIVLFKTACNVTTGKYQFYFEPIKPMPGQPKKYGVAFDCNSPGEDGVLTENQMIDLLAGQYKFMGWTNVSSVTMNIYSNEMSPVYFNVHPDKATYIGRITLIVGYDENKYKLGVYKTETDKDVKNFLKLLPNIKPSDVVIDYATFEGR